MSTSKTTILHLFTPAPNLSPFDVNMAIDAGWDHCIPYTGISADDVEALTQDAIFSRGPTGVKATGIFIGGRDIYMAMDMLALARKSMVPPFEVAVFADPSGAFTTAAAMVACAEKELVDRHAGGLEGRRVLVFGGTGPVGATCAVLAARAGARTVIVSHTGKDTADETVTACGARFTVDLEGADGSSDSAIKALLEDAEVVFGAAKAGVQVLNADHLAKARRLLVACDVNAVPPEGIEGVDVGAKGTALESASGEAVGIGAMAVGNVKYKVQHALLKEMVEAPEARYLDFADAWRLARDLA
ncbi:MAG: NAD(P)-dependent methylenetetrahydromethanopterin dehydrogenase [Gammaproteobacteria bacterium]|nr:NAD(P)-dependent methylenetetrahydromethanopterin dehydrogenase [Gammaproteobacteria bacterium]